MRLDKLYIQDFKNLHKLQLDFDQDSLSTVVVGRNGTGKSNVLEALVLIFRSLDLDGDVSFGYSIEYICRGEHIRIDTLSGKAVYSLKADGEFTPITKKAFKETTSRGQRRYLPSHVFGYYSGPSNRLETHFDDHQRLFYRQLLNGNADATLRPLLYARAMHSQFVLLAFFGLQEDTQQRFLREYLGIEGVDSVLFTLSEPGWAKAKQFRAFGWFWRAKGMVRGLLDHLHRLALAPLTLDKVSVPTSLARKESRDHFYLFLQDDAALSSLVSQYPSQQAFFAALESAYISELIREVRVRVRVAGSSDVLSFRELSEGEQQLLTVLGLLKFTMQDEALFLLDEPDTHLNPAWSVEYLDLLNRVVGTQPTCHLVLTTHNPLVIAGLTKSQVQLLERSKDGAISARQPDEDPRGMGVAALLTSEIYGLRSELDLYTLEKIEAKRRLSQKEKLTAEEKALLAEINKYLEGKAFMTSDRDPAYQSWAELRQLAEQALGVKGSSLTPDQAEALHVQIEGWKADLQTEGK